MSFLPHSAKYAVSILAISNAFLVVYGDKLTKSYIECSDMRDDLRQFYIDPESFLAADHSCEDLVTLHEQQNEEAVPEDDGSLNEGPE